MTKLELIEKSVSELSSEELKRFREWFAAFEADQWDRQIESDVAAGRLDHLGEQALVHYRAGRTKPL